MNNSVVTAVHLSAFDLFKSLSECERANIATFFKIKRVPKGQYVISETHPGDDVYFLMSGAVHACAFTHNGKQVQFEVLGAGMMFGELSALDGHERSSNCIAVSPVSLLALSSVDFHRLIDEYKPVRDVVIQRLAYMVRLHMRKLYELSTFPVNQRVRFEILRIASKVATGLDNRAQADAIVLGSVPTHQEIAARIGTHREAVTRELKSLESAGAITWRPGEYVIHDLTQLTASVSS